MADSSRTLGPFYVDKLTVCPLNETHVILESRLQYHIVRCLRTFPHPEKVQKCPFNATHLILLPSSLEAHMANCPDSNSLVMFKYSGGERSDLKETLHPMDKREIPSEEIWSDGACKSPSYDFLQAKAARACLGPKKRLVDRVETKIARRCGDRFAGRRVTEEITYNPLTAAVEPCPEDAQSSADSKYSRY